MRSLGTKRIFDYAFLLFMAYLLVDMARDRAWWWLAATLGLFVLIVLIFDPLLDWYVERKMKDGNDEST